MNDEWYMSEASLLTIWAKYTEGKKQHKKMHPH
jgi:hypothetical protein